MRDDIDFEYFRNRLENRLKKLTGVENTVRPMELDQTRVGRLSRMDAMQHREMAQAAKRLAAFEVQRIQTALKRMASGDYGYCIQCDEKIAQGRLEVDPSSLSCIECARLADGK